MEFTKDEKNALEWLFIKGMEITNSDKKHQIFDVMHKRLVNNLPISSVVKSLCKHHWVNAKNIAVKSGQMCVKCHSVKA